MTDKAAAEPWRYASADITLPRTNPSGEFEVGGVLPGSRVAVYVNKPGYSGVWSERVLADRLEGITWPELRLAPAAGQVSGMVVDSQGRPVADALVSVDDIARPQTKTDANGRFHLRNLPARETVLRVSGERGRWVRKLTPEGQSVDVKLRADR